MAMLCALDWRHYGVIATLTQDQAGGARLVLSHGADELVVHLSWASLDALTYAGLQCPRPPGADAWDLSRLSCSDRLRDRSGRPRGVPQPPMIGRQTERARLLANVARGRHTLLVGPIGAGKTHLLRAVAAEVPEAVYVPHVQPLRLCLLGLAERLHARGQLVLADGDGRARRPGPSARAS